MQEAPATDNANDFDQEMFEAAVGPRRTTYYLSRFERFHRGGSRISWNWPAFFISFFWLLYRKMWGLAVAYLFLPAIVTLLLAIVLGAMLGETGVWLAFAFELTLIFIIVPMFANALYYVATSKRVTRAMVYANTRQRQLRTAALSGGTSSVALIVAVVVFAAVVPMIGIIAAIAIPAYQDYTIRAQVSEGLNLVAASKAAVAETYRRQGFVPSNRAAAGMTADPYDTQGKYVEAVEIVNGRIDIRYGNEAHARISGRTLSLTPYGMNDQPNTVQIVWVCARAPAPAGAIELAPYASGNLDPNYLPSACRQ